MAKKIVKYLLRGLLCTLAVLIVLPALLYIPAIQNFIRLRTDRIQPVRATHPAGIPVKPRD